MPYTKIINVKLESQYLHCNFFHVVLKHLAERGYSTGAIQGGPKTMGLLYFPLQELFLCKYILMIFLTKIKFFKAAADFLLFPSVKKVPRNWHK